MFLFFTALLLGMAGSFHCIGMCGPLALALPGAGDSHFSRFTGSLLYNLGRIITYSFLGFLLGWIGYSAGLLGVLQWLSILAGVVILIYLAFRKFAFFQGDNAFYSVVRKGMGALYKNNNHLSLLAFGLLNGLVPCGLVYVALTSALATANPGRSAMFMAAFGLGTVPLMWAFTFFSKTLGGKFRMRFNRIYPYILFIVAVLLILRGLGIQPPGLHWVNQDAVDCGPSK